MLRNITRSSLQNNIKKISTCTNFPQATVAVNNNQTTTTTARWKHSKRQVKKMQFKQSAVHRSKLLYKNTGILDELLNQSLPTRRFEAVYEAPNGFLPNGWSAPPPDDFVIPDYPFAVERTKNKPHGAAGFLPVYSDIRLGGTKRTTIIRKVKGDLDAFIQELRAVLKIHDAQKDVRVRTAGCAIEVNGSHGREVRAWLAGLGF